MPASVRVRRRPVQMALWCLWPVLAISVLQGCSESNPRIILRNQGADVTVNDDREITEVDFNGEATDADLETLTGLTTITSLDLSGTSVTDAGLSKLKGLENLRTLDLSNTDITDAGLDALADLKSLRTLSLGETLVTSDGLAAHLPSVESLQELSLASREKPVQPQERGFLSAIRLGIDLAGGANMVFQVRETDEKEITDAVMDQMVGAVARRLNPGGTEELTVRQVGADRIEVIIPGADPEVVRQKVALMTRLGSLEFGILANRRDHADLIRQAEQLSPNETALKTGDRVLARWHEVADQNGKPKPVSEHGDVATREVERMKTVDGKRLRVRVKEFLIVIDAPNQRVTGDYLTRASSMVDQQTGELGVSFQFDTRGGFLFGKLTGDNGPAQDGFKRRLAILLDGFVHSAPNLREPITGGSGQITGGFTQVEADELKNVLNAGALAVPIDPVPISQEQISPLLGADVQEKGRTAIIIATATVLVFMLAYYLLAGGIADLCLVLNLILVMGAMALIDAAFTLPGLAGIVLTIGMAVDANVLIFERIREELRRGSSLRMAIQNGFDRAFTTIVDANVTTLITAVILYMIGTDQVAGFAVTLFIGIMMSMFTALYFGRLIFDICERKRWITDLKMLSIVGQTNWNFLGKKSVAAVVSLVLIVAGMGTFFARGEDNLDIDFSGGTMITFEFADDAANRDLSIDEVRSFLQKTSLGSGITLEELSVYGGDGSQAAAVEGHGKRYRLRTKEQEIGKVTAALNEGLTDTGHPLRRVTVDVGEITAIPEADEEADPPVPASEFAGGHEVELTFSDQIKIATAADYFNRALQTIKREGTTTDAPKYDDSFSVADLRGDESTAEEVTQVGEQPGYSRMTLLASSDVSEDDLRTAVTSMRETLANQPVYEGVNTFESAVASEMQVSALMAMLASLFAIVAYIWLRFQRITFGLAAVAALVHDVLIVLGAVALASYAYGAGIGFLGFEDFKINLPMIAAFLTIVGYSLNDTIVVFDRIREIRGKNPALTAEMVNVSLNQTLSRTLLTSMTTFIVVGILYAIGGEGIHGFAFCLVVGVIVGTYSSIFVASPVLLWLMSRSSEDQPPATTAGAATAGPAAGGK